MDSSPSEPPGKARDTGVGSLSLLQGRFPTQGSNWQILPAELLEKPVALAYRKEKFTVKLEHDKQ